jgi:hypothetical protein
VFIDEAQSTHASGGNKRDARQWLVLKTGTITVIFGLKPLRERQRLSVPPSLPGKVFGDRN